MLFIHGLSTSFSTPFQAQSPQLSSSLQGIYKIGLSLPPQEGSESGKSGGTPREAHPKGCETPFKYLKAKVL